jgi:hypothetical protein
LPERLGSIEQAREHCRDVFGWYNHQHQRSGIGATTPVAVHHDPAHQFNARRVQVPAPASAPNRERFARERRAPPELSTAVRINKPHVGELAH